MLYYFAALLAAALLLLLTNPRSESNRWAAFFLGFASIGGLADTLAAAEMNILAQLVQLMNHTITPYGVLVFSMVYSDKVANARVRLLLKGLLLLPAAVMLCITPVAPRLELDYRILLAWTAPYYLASCYLLLFSLWSEDNSRRKRNRFIIALIMVPTLLAVLILINVANVISPAFDYFRYISLFIFYSLTVAVLCTFAYGVLGVKLRFERDQWESTRKAVSSGTTILNHTIKNEIGKIAISTENLKSELSAGSPEAAEQLRIIETASSHMLAMVTSIHSQTRSIVLREQPIRLDELAERCLQQQPLEGRPIQLKLHLLCRPTVLCDSLHLLEALNNLVQNAIEAIPEGEAGEVNVTISWHKRAVRLLVSDTGRGMNEEQLKQALEPFYSTKNRSRNFGLGLAYVYNVVQQSAWTIKLSSVVGKGTDVLLHVPARKVLEIKEGIG
ncbi:HAMP domain-containing sensor histidine kinase [Paenibacillus sp. KS-LC4]|uniref:sensor histidine kinase n=1 Tax=Paenibacillus sp. KS-LC4 TaxID=2979727 RepID=UPI0030CF3E5C